MPTDPYVPVPLDAQPRQQQNFAPGVAMPPARAWRANRPGDVRARPPRGPLTGTPGPNVGFALTLARRARDRFRLESGEHADDAVAVVAELAMKRAATFGRAPTKIDVDFAVELLGYAGAAPDDVRRWRPGLVRGAHHDYVVRRAIADTVSASLLRVSIQDLPGQLAVVRAAMAAGDTNTEPGDGDASSDAVAPRAGADVAGMTARVRFSPAPSGDLHVGSARTALFNWLFARHSEGTFLLRIEDTDRSRTREDWVDAIGDTLRWLGLDWDESAWRQSDRIPEYLAAADALVASGHAYECYDTPEELDAMHAERKAAKLPPGYDGRGRDLTAGDRARLAAEGRPRTVRFRTPDEGRSTFTDIVRGEVSVDWSTISDFVIVRSDGSPLFFLANAVDDLAMGITHVIRGEDLIDTTHRVLAIRRALSDAAVPAYAHLPLILQADRAKLSKRHGAVAVEDFRSQGILAEALVNYLSLLGWAPDDGREVMTRDEIVAAFTLERVTPSAAVFDAKKLEWLNGEWIRRISLDDLVDRLAPYLAARGTELDATTLRSAVVVGQERATTLVALAEQMDFLGAGREFVVADAVWDAVAGVDRAAEVLDAVIAHVSACDWTVEALDLRPAIDALGLKPRQVMKLLYAAVEGRTAGLPLFDSMQLLGRDETVARLRAARLRTEG